MTPAERAKLEAWKAEAAAEFRTRRCWCGAPAIAVEPGSDRVREAGITLRPAIRDRNLCLAHAMPVRSAA